MKKTFLFLASIATAFYLGVNTQPNKEVKVKSVDDYGTKVVTEYSDGSFAVIKDGEFHFQPVDMGDWDYYTNDENEFNNIVESYLENKNNN